MKNETVRFRYGTIGKGSIHLKGQNLSVKRRKKVNVVDRQGSFPQTLFADDGNGSPCVSSWKLSVCGHNLIHLTESTFA